MRSFFVTARSQANKGMLPDYGIVNLPDNSAAGKKLFTPDFFHQSGKALRLLSPRGRSLAREVFACCFSTTSATQCSYSLPKSSQTKLSQDALRASQHPRVNFRLNINCYENENFFLISDENLATNINEI